jgi:acyl carrier protein
MTSGSSAARVKAIMVRVLDLDVRPEQINDDLSLYSASIPMDSLGFLNLIIALEAEFGRQIDDEDVMGADVETVADLIRLFEDKLVAEPLRDQSASAGRAIDHRRMP